MRKQKYKFNLPISSIIGAIRSVTPTSNRHMISNKKAVAIIVHLARCGKSSGSMTLYLDKIKKKNKQTDLIFLNSLIHR
jgi:hypothetical protein